MIDLRKETEALFREPVDSMWSPAWAPHVVGFFTKRQVGLDGPEPQKYRCYCTTCNVEHRGECATGAIRSHVSHFAAVHLHRDPFNSCKAANSRGSR